MNQGDRAVENYKTALEQAKILYSGQPEVAHILNNLGMTLQQAGKYNESLQYLKEAKEILDNHIDEGYLTLKVLHNIRASYHDLGMFLLAFQFYKDALDILDKTMISDESYKTLCKSMIAAVMKLSSACLTQAAVEIIEPPPTNDVHQAFNFFYGSSLLRVLRRRTR